VQVLRVGQTVTIEVADSGPGIPAEHRDKVFDRFYRIDEGRSRETGGAGLGLSIAKWIAEAHGGSLELDCRPKGGCIFRLSLPASFGQSPQNEAPEGSAHQQPAGREEVLVPAGSNDAAKDDKATKSNPALFLNILQKYLNNFSRVGSLSLHILL
jgi:hypothetical protein